MGYFSAGVGVVAGAGGVVLGGVFCFELDLVLVFGRRVGPVVVVVVVVVGFAVVGEVGGGLLGWWGDLLGLVVVCRRECVCGVDAEVGRGGVLVGEGHESGRVADKGALYLRWVVAGKKIQQLIFFF